MAATTLPVSAWWVVRAGNRRRRVAADQLVEVIAWPRITPVPLAPDLLLGITRYGDRIVPVLDLLATGLADAGANPTSVVILKTRVARQDIEFGMAVEEVSPGDESSADELSIENILAPLLARG